MINLSLILIFTLQDYNRIQQHFSAEKHLTLWRALPAIEELQTAWEAKCDNPRSSKYRTAINDGLAKLNKYYSQFDEKPAYILALGKSFISFNSSLELIFLPSITSILQTHLHQACMGRCRRTRSRTLMRPGLS
jgi:hypothetical protein